MDDGARVVAGEPVELLALALQRFKVVGKRDGCVFFDATIPQDVAFPLRRAMMRIEAELLAAEADQISGSHPEPRTDDQRRADALMALVLRIDDARDRNG